MQAVPGAHFGDYMLSYRLGVGGMAEVWAAEHSALGVKVALKLLFNASPTLYERLLREGRAQARLEHPNILPVLNVVHVHGVSALVLPLIEGPSLEQLLSGHRPSPAEAAALLRAIVAGVAHAHHHGMIHRDLKPGNVLLEVRGGQVVPQVADFGIVKTDDDPRYTREGAMMGTLNYAAPEQLLDAGAVNHRADLFSLGVMLVELLSGKLPFVAASLGKLLNAHDHPPDLSGVPPAWRPLCQQLLQIEPDDRMADCAGLLVGLAALSPPDDRILAYDGALATAIREMMQRSDAPGFGRGLTEPPPRRPSITTPPPNNLPAEMDDFFGRAHDITALESTIAAGARLVSVLSAGGMGKTRLAIRFGHTALAQFPGGVWFCDLSEARQHDAMAY
ncbi:MAG: serine/threonine-protein kinase, partial [Myxococcota bacterium]